MLSVAPHKKLVDLAHEGYQGLVKTKLLLRAKVWFPYMDSMVEEKIKSCVPCTATVKDEKRFQLQMSNFPSTPWTNVSVDFSGPYLSGDYCLVVIDDCSRFPLIELLKSTSARSVITVLDKIFAVHGMPENLKSDNGPPFQSFEFKKFVEYCGIKHRKITPFWPRANGLADNFMKPWARQLNMHVLKENPGNKHFTSFSVITEPLLMSQQGNRS